MSKEPRPPWLISQENGSIGEARTRAFLLDRFWVLERSVDIEGADFIIQRRITTQSLLDRRAPCLGFVQAKYFGNASTTHYVHREYVLGINQQPRTEFFLICHAGMEDSARAFFLSAADIVNSFEETGPTHSIPGRFALPGTEILVQRFQIIDIGNVLDQIDRALRNADFEKNRSFLSWALPRQSKSFVPILPLYEEPIDNWWGDIPKGFDNLREGARKAQGELEEVLGMLRSIELSEDPENALNIAEEITNNWGERLTLPKLFNEDFLTVARYHRRRYEQLHKEGLVGAFVSLRRSATYRLIADIAPRMPLARDQVYILKVRYDPLTLVNVYLESRFASLQELWPDLKFPLRHGYTDIPDTHGVLSSGTGYVEIYLLPGRYAYQDIVNGELVDSLGSWEDRLQDVAIIAIRTLLEIVLDERFGQ